MQYIYIYMWQGDFVNHAHGSDRTILENSVRVSPPPTLFLTSAALGCFSHCLLPLCLITDAPVELRRPFSRRPIRRNIPHMTEMLGRLNHIKFLLVSILI